MDVCEKFDDCRSNRSSVIRAAHFVMDDERQSTVDGGQGNRWKHHNGVSFKQEAQQNRDSGRVVQATLFATRLKRLGQTTQ